MQVREGQTEKEIEAILLNELFSHGADGLSFNPIVAAGDNSAQPHAKARADYKIKSGDALLREEAISALKEELLPLATLLTPNLPEAAKILLMYDLNTLQQHQELEKNIYDMHITSFIY